ncbi:efflux RND transporter permease subunit [Zhongshania sp. BJYM1]|jgi:HAE1 family hydrophobic/amphiphilic exporter-1|uniref:efflux RND transporter permease subunit n=1 Tax=Zhongshania aquatica TaxID=2965069 RepID=UPI0022B470A1|nr:efflux RND transporter permease subunit [Marortus sp. BJYM1]
MWISDLSIRRPVFATMLIGALVVLGSISLVRLGVNFFPELDIPYVSVTTALEGASPETIETEVTDVIEEAVNTIAGLKLLRSVSSEGLSQVFLEFQMEDNLDVKVQDVRDKLDLARRNLPLDIEPPIVEKVDPASAPILSVMIASKVPISELTVFAEDIVKNRLQRVAGVGTVTVIGGRERQIRIWLNAERLRAYALTADEVVQAIKREHVEVPGGRIETKKKDREFGVKTKGEVGSVREFEELIVAFDRQAPIKLGDVARIEDGLEDERTYAELDGRIGISLDIRRQSGTNVVAVANAVKEALNEVRALAPEGTTIVTAQDRSLFTEASIRDTFSDMIFAIGLVGIVTWFFLLSIGATLIVSIAMPCALIATFFAFYTADFTINMMTLIALAMAIGLLVDDAIVVLESIQRDVEGGMSPTDAASHGVDRVGGAVIAATVAIMAVYVPIAFMEGVIGRFFREYGLTVVFSIGVSLLVSLTLTPALCARILKPQAHIGGISSRIDRSLSRLEDWYGRMLNISIRYRYFVVTAALGSVVIGVLVAQRLAIDFVPSFDRSEFIADVELEQGTGISQSRELAMRAATELAKIKHVDNVFFTVGGSQAEQVNEISYFVKLVHKQDRSSDQFDVIAEARKVLYKVVPEAKTISVSEMPIMTGGGLTSFDMEYALIGPDLGELERITEEVMLRMRETDIYADIHSTYKIGRPELQIEVDRAKAADLGVSIKGLANNARIMLGGMDVTSYEENGERIEVRAQMEEGDRADMRWVELIQSRASDKSLIDLANVANLRFASGPAQIERQSRSRKIGIFANTQPGVALGTATQELDRIIADVGLPEGYSGLYLGHARRMQDSTDAIIFAFALALLSLYMILASLFNSFVQPLIVMVTAPLSFIGAFTMLYFFNQPLNIFVQIALIALMGLVMKNGILLVDLANQFREAGKASTEAVLSAGPQRLRPVLMTALSTVLGMVPVALANSDGSELRNPVGFLVIGGMSSSTILTLAVLPAAYVIADDAARSLRKLKSVALRC